MKIVSQGLDQAIDLLTNRLISERTAQGLWEGELSSSAVSTAVASFALSKLSHQDSDLISRSRHWLAHNINSDGGWGDTPDSPSNLSATLLTRAALMLDHEPTDSTANALVRSEQWIIDHLGGASKKHIIDGVKNFYGKDFTFSAPILTICALSPMFDNDQKVWSEIPKFPFEFAVLPHQTYHLLKLPVVSYALPALIAVGIAQFKHDSKLNPISRIIRRLSVKPSLKKLLAITPSNGGFLEAVPLTAFVASCLGCSGYNDHIVVKKALQFLRSTIREDGSWAIDTNLSQWVSSLAIKSLDSMKIFSDEEKHQLAKQLISHQFTDVHPFTHAKPGGWGWTNLPGAVPEADDTAGTLIALALLRPKVTPEIEAGIQWLLNLMNRDGGVPTFCKGWGLLPFDRSCPDISSHALQAFTLWLPYLTGKLKFFTEKAISGLIRYLESCRDTDNAWTPLWFGDQNAPNQANRVYGTSTVLINLYDQPYQKIKHLVDPAVAWLWQVRNSDGGWGGELNTPSLFETTAQAVAALALYSDEVSRLHVSIDFLVDKIIDSNGCPAGSPIGLYFASLWYSEKLYPVIFGLRALKLVKSGYGSKVENNS